MKPQEIINMVSLDNCTPEDLILRQGKGIAIMSWYFKLNPRQSTSELANHVVDRLTEKEANTCNTLFKLTE